MLTLVGRKSIRLRVCAYNVRKQVLGRLKLALEVEVAAEKTNLEL